MKITGFIRGVDLRYTKDETLKRFELQTEDDVIRCEGYIYGQDDDAAAFEGSYNDAGVFVVENQILPTGSKEIAERVIRLAGAGQSLVQAQINRIIKLADDDCDVFALIDDPDALSKVTTALNCKWEEKIDKFVDAVQNTDWAQKEKRVHDKWVNEIITKGKENAVKPDLYVECLSPTKHALPYRKKKVAVKAWKAAEAAGIDFEEWINDPDTKTALLDDVMDDDVVEAQVILEALKKQRDLVLGVGHYTKNGLSQAEAIKLINAGMTPEVIKGYAAPEDPYGMTAGNAFLAMIKYGINLAHADKYALKALDDPQNKEFAMTRIIGLVYRAVQIMAAGGNTSTALTDLFGLINWMVSKQAYRTQPIPGPLYFTALYSPALKNSLGFDVIGDMIYVGMIRDKQDEDDIVMYATDLNKAAWPHTYPETVEDIEDALGIHYNSGQHAAFNLLKCDGIKILTGPPGSGKTAVIKGLIKQFLSDPLYDDDDVALAATTGRAAEVMANACEMPAKTVHSLLGLIPDGHGGFTELPGRDNIKAKLLIVDECSMMDLQLMAVLLKMVKPGTILILVGDADQLEPVGRGNVFHDFIISGQFEVCRLTEIMRQSGTICANAAKVNAGNLALVTDDTFEIITCDDFADVMYELKKRVGDHLSDTQQIICPMRKRDTDINTFKINQQLQNPQGNAYPLTSAYGVKYYIGDRIIFTRNDPDIGYNNGDMGVITGRSIEHENGLQIKHGNKIYDIDDDHLADIDLAYAITVHKSQGSEFDEVHVVLDDSPMAQRRLLYTAITRAKKKVVLYSVNDGMRHAIKDTHKHAPRMTLLAQKLAGTQESVIPVKQIKPVQSVIDWGIVIKAIRDNEGSTVAAYNAITASLPYNTETNAWLCDHTIALLQAISCIRLLLTSNDTFARIVTRQLYSAYGIAA